MQAWVTQASYADGDVSCGGCGCTGVAASLTGAVVYDVVLDARCGTGLYALLALLLCVAAGVVGMTLCHVDVCATIQNVRIGLIAVVTSGLSGDTRPVSTSTPIMMSTRELMISTGNFCKKSFMSFLSLH